MASLSIIFFVLFHSVLGSYLGWVGTEWYGYPPERPAGCVARDLSFINFTAIGNCVYNPSNSQYFSVEVPANQTGNIQYGFWLLCGSDNTCTQCQPEKFLFEMCAESRPPTRYFINEVVYPSIPIVTNTTYTVVFNSQCSEDPSTVIGVNFDTDFFASCDQQCYRNNGTYTQTFCTLPSFIENY